LQVFSEGKAYSAGYGRYDDVQFFPSLGLVRFFAEYLEREDFLLDGPVGGETGRPIDCQIFVLLLSEILGM
jgi:hypothetical protein